MLVDKSYTAGKFIGSTVQDATDGIRLLELQRCCLSLCYIYYYLLLFLSDRKLSGS